MNLILPIILILSSIGIFFGYVDPNYKGSSNAIDSEYSSYGIVPLRDELKTYQDIAKSSNQIVTDRDNLMEKRNKISESDRVRLERFLPSNIDNIRLIIEISDIASRRGLVVKNILVEDTKIKSDSIGVVDSAYGILSLKFSVNATYDEFLPFLKDLESNLRLVNITDISFVSKDIGGYDFSVGLNTYWLK